ncbi:MAG: trehalose-phosphatase [Novosphingobium sp.]|nr:trehalose-phosphatase [Novosphingobium sp.]
MDQFRTLTTPPPPDALAQGASLALFLDFDGTLVDIAPTPESIAVPDRLAMRLLTLSKRLDGRMALVSGRSLADLDEHLGPLGIARAGSHGSDCLSADGARIGAPPRAIDPAIERELGVLAASYPGLFLERKSHGAALHFRAAPALEADVTEAAQTIAERHGLQAKSGKCVVELVRPEASKANAVQQFMSAAPFAGAIPVFVGDDVTDEDGFRAASDLGGFGVIVGNRHETSARYRINDPSSVLRWLQI